MTFVNLENEQDFKNEDELAAFLASKWKCQMERQKKYSAFDFVALKGTHIKAFVELRCRSNAHDKYPDCYISATKLLHAYTMKSALDVNSLFVVSWTDKIGYVSLNTPFPVEWSKANWKRRNPNDVEMIGRIPTESFIFYDKSSPEASAWFKEQRT